MMTYIISGFLIITNFISALLKGKGSILKILLLTFMWVLFWGSNDNADYLNYKQLYDYISYTGAGFSTSQFGFVQIMKFATKLGLQYHHFLMIISLIGIYMITETVKKYTDKPHLVYTLYFIHPFLLDIVQVKHFLAMAIIVYCFRYLEQDGNKNNIKFIAGILIATSIHLISIIFLPLLFIKKMSIRKLVLLVASILIVGIPIAYSDVLQFIALNILGIQRIETYFLNRARFGFFIQFFIQGTIFLMVLLSRKILTKRRECNKFIDLIYRTNLYLIVLFPLYIINGTFERGFRMIMILNYILISKLFSTSKKREKIVILVFIFIFAFSLFMYYTFIPYKGTVFFPIFENNLIFN